MLRFYTKKVHCISKKELDKEQLKEYFINGHRNEEVYIVDNQEFIGRVTYYSLINNDDFIIKDYLTLDENIWNNAGDLFKAHKVREREKFVLPVVNKLKQLVCFAWQDNEANRELRMLDELVERKDALNFKDIYPNHNCVTIYDCNELAYYLVQYLKKCGIVVNVIGSWWEYFFIQEQREVQDYRNFVVYAEGVGNKGESAEESKSVSAEFECIDHIYEENICRGIIKDAKEEFSDLIEELRERQIAILGVGEAAQNAYDLLLSYGIDIECFVSAEKNGKSLLGKRIIDELAVEEFSAEVIFIDTQSKYSAWGFGKTDYYYYMGYKRNDRFFMLQDYIEIPQNGLLNVFEYMIKRSGGRLVLLGDIWLCLKLNQTLKAKNKALYNKAVYADILRVQSVATKLVQIDEDGIVDQDLCVLLIPEFYGNKDDPQKVKRITEQRERYLNELKKLNVTNVFEYSLSNIFVMDWEKNKALLENPKFKAGGIVIGAINGFSGNKFFRDLLDNHPNILMLDWSSLNNNLYLFCLRLSVTRSDKIMSLFWELCNEQKGAPDENFESDFLRKELFDHYMEEMLEEKEYFTSQELFVMIHVAYAKMWGREIRNISEMIIYWEPHHVPRDKCEEYAAWLYTAGENKYIVNVVRNAYVSAGSYLKLLNRLHIFSYGASVFAQIFRQPNEKKKNYSGWDRIVLRFEDIKCYPEEKLGYLCNQLNIAWSDTLLETTTHGKPSALWGVAGFDLKPVHCTYEEYFSSFDRFRISLITAPWQKRYGYPYVNNMDFSRRELQEIFSKDFRFENERGYRSRNEKEKIKKEVTRIVDDYLQMNRREEIMERKNMNECREKENFVV